MMGNKQTKDFWRVKTEKKQNLLILISYFRENKKGEMGNGR